MIKTVTLSQAQYAYDNQFDPRLEVECDDDHYEDCEYHRTELVEQYVTHANARDFDDLCQGYVNGDPNAWLTKLIGFEENHWAHKFVADELEALANDVYPSDDEIEAAAERSAKAVYALYN
jgi:hypothetical protein